FSSALWKHPAIYEAAVKGLPQKRMAEPEAIAGIALYLASSASDFTTGATIVVDRRRRTGLLPALLLWVWVS
ncbi:MAG TPA: SDR family oxidoreductase, partial [Caldilineae bacterium]|nr:SDR family oxidoreductase [Caldilineae bacterium]